MKKNYEQIVLTKDNQGEDLGKVMGDVILLLLKEDEAVCVRAEDCGVFIIEHNHDNRRDYWGTPTNMWLEDEEVDLVESYRERQECEFEGDTKEEDDCECERDEIEGKKESSEDGE